MKNTQLLMAANEFNGSWMPKRAVFNKMEIPKPETVTLKDKKEQPNPFIIPLETTPAYEKREKGIEEMRKLRTAFINQNNLPPFIPKKTDEPQAQTNVG